MNLSNGKISLIATFITIAAICTFILFVIRQSAHIKKLYAKTIHAQNVIVHANEVENIIARYKDLRKIYALTGDSLLPGVLDSISASTQKSEQQLTALTLNDSEQKAGIDSLIKYLNAFSQASTRQYRPTTLQRELQMTITADAIQTISRQLQADAKKNLQSSGAESDISTFRFGPLLYLLIGLLAVLITVLIQQSFTHIKAEKKAEAETHYNNLLVEQFDDAIISTDEKLNITRWNKKAEKLFGWKAGEISGKPITTALKFDMEQGRGALILRKVMTDGLWEGEITLAKKGGELITLHACCTLLRKGTKNVAGTITIIKDVAKKSDNGSSNNYEANLGKMLEDRTSEIRLVVERLVASEKKYKLLFDYSPLPMWMISLQDMQITDVNDAAVKRFGYSRRAFLQLGVGNLVKAEEAAIFEAGIQKSSSGYHEIGTWRQPTKDGNLIHAELFTYNILLEGVPMCMLLSNDITHKVIAEEKIKQSLDAIRLLTAHLQNVREEERKNISRDIHDELGQHLTVIKMDVSWLNRKLGEQDAQLGNRLKKMLETTDVTIKFVRRLCSELRPVLLDDMGLIAALQWHAKRFEANTGIAITLQTPSETLAISDDSQTALFRIFQETLTNVAKYAGATSVTATLTADKEDYIEMWVTDDGIGFDPAIMKNTQSLGILGMRERCIILGGSFEISSKPRNGTTVYASVPTVKKQVDEILLVNELKNYKNHPTN